MSNRSLSLGLINHRDISVISKRGYLTVNRRTGIMIDLGVAVFIQTAWFELLSLRVAAGYHNLEVVAQKASQRLSS